MLTAAKVHLRHMTTRDLPAVLAVERASFNPPWEEADFRRELARGGNCLAMCASVGGEMVGFFMASYEPDRLEVLNLAVHPNWRRCGVGTQMLDKLKAKTAASLVPRFLDLAVSERDTHVHLFLKANGFRCTEVLRGWCEDGSDSYLFEFHVDEQGGRA